MLEAIPDEELASARRTLVAVDAAGKMTPLGLSDGQDVLLTKPGAFAILSDADYVREELQKLAGKGTTLRLHGSGPGSAGRKVKVVSVSAKRLSGATPSSSYEFAVTDEQGNSGGNLNLSDIDSVASDDAATQEIARQLVVRSAKDARTRLRQLLAMAPAGTVSVGYLHRVPAPQFRSEGRIRKGEGTYASYVQLSNTIREDWSTSMVVAVEGLSAVVLCSARDDGPLCTIRRAESHTGVSCQVLTGFALPAG